MSDPFEDADGRFLVLVNEEGQHSLWPAHIAVPDGWGVTHPADSRSACVDYVEANWTDMRPRSLVQSERA